jgi:gamma-glutamyl-gamma-aminobutyrate hydrolase PuuD/predicted ATP-grasp superfamily ATP-dependent carboligase
VNFLGKGEGGAPDRTTAKPAGRVILTYGRSLMALVIARSLARQGIEVIGCDDVSMTVLTFSKHVRETFVVSPWETRPADFLDDLEAAVRTYAPRDGVPYVLMPAFRDIELIARHRERFEPLIKISAPSVASLDMVNPKDRLSDLAAHIGLPAPQGFSPRSIDEVAAFEDRLPLVVKPVTGVGGRGVSIAYTPEELREQTEALGFEPPPLIQTFAAGEDYCVGVLARDGVIEAMMAYKNIATYPRKAGAGAIRESVDAEPFRDAVARLMLETKWNGVCEIDFRWDGEADHVPQVIEVNARFWAGIFHSIETGVDFPWLLYLQTIGKRFDEPEPQIGVVTKTPAVWLLATLEDVAASDPHLSAAADAWRLAKENLATGKVVRAMEAAVSALGATASAKDVLDAMSQAVARNRDAPSELSDKDPLVGLGALFILSHLVRHRKLPPEITYKPDEAPAEQAPARPQRKRPVIGITKPVRGDLWAWWAMKLAVWLAGGYPIKVTAKAPRDPQTIDGLIFGGGSDVYPKHYEGTPKPGYRYDLARGDMEASWAASARRHDLPALGVCRGAQMLNVFAGGTLHNDLTSYDKVVSSDGLVDPLLLRKPIEVRRDSRLSTIIGAGRVCVNAIHKQAIERVGAGLRVVAREPNGIVQAIEDPTRRFWIGVQFHPELMIYRKTFRDLFKALVEAARDRAEERATERAAHLEAMSGEQPTAGGLDGAATVADV